MYKSVNLHWVIRSSYWEAKHLKQNLMLREQAAKIILYNFLILILWGQLLILITFHSCFLAIIYARVSYLMT